MPCHCEVYPLTWYAMSGTETTWGICLCFCHAMSGTDSVPSTCAISMPCLGYLYAGTQPPDARSALLAQSKAISLPARYAMPGTAKDRSRRCRRTPHDAERELEDVVSQHRAELLQAAVKDLAVPEDLTSSLVDHNWEARATALGVVQVSGQIQHQSVVKRVGRGSNAQKQAWSNAGATGYLPRTSARTDPFWTALGNAPGGAQARGGGGRGGSGCPGPDPPRHSCSEIRLCLLAIEAIQAGVGAVCDGTEVVYGALVTCVPSALTCNVWGQHNLVRHLTDDLVQTLPAL
eukprot:2107043-Rhodomonas_salina.4